MWLNPVNWVNSGIYVNFSRLKTQKFSCNYKYYWFRLKNLPVLNLITGSWCVIFGLFQNLPFAAECDLKPTSHSNSPVNLYKHEPAYVLPSGFDLSKPPPGYKPYNRSQPLNNDIGSDSKFVGRREDRDVEVTILMMWHFHVLSCYHQH